jgi:hypothetical protein
MIPCTSDCIYQKHGECSLDRAVSAGQLNADNKNKSCAYYVKKSKREKNQ